MNIYSLPFKPHAIMVAKFYDQNNPCYILSEELQAKCLVLPYQQWGNM